MINKTNIHSFLRTIGFLGLFLVIFSNSSRFETPLIDVKFNPYIIMMCLISISLGLYFKIKFAKEEPSVLTYIVTFITLLFALIIASSFLVGFFFSN
jgi:fumarate reductase subunit C